MPIITENRQSASPPAAPKFYRHPLIGRLMRFFTWWLIFVGIYASSSVCPFCGRVGCPVGGASAGIVGGFFALVLEYGKALWTRLSQLVPLNRFKPKPDAEALTTKCGEEHEHESH
jgi:hypothetical protein